MTLISGVGGVLAPVLGGHNANIAGPMTAISSSEQTGENPEGRYVATVVDGVLFALFGIFAGGAGVRAAREADRRRMPCCSMLVGLLPSTCRPPTI